MGTAELKTNINQLLNGINDDSLLQAVYTLLSKATANDDWYDNLPKEAKESIRRGIKDADNKRFVDQKDVQSKVDQLLGRI